MSQDSPVDGARSTEPGVVSSTLGDRPSRPAPTFSGSSTAASRRVWDRLSEQERREHLESMDPDALRSLAASMPVIEQAKGVLMGCYGCDAPTAFALLIRASAARNVKLRELAAAVVATASGANRAAPGPLTSPSERVRRLLEDTRDHLHTDTDGSDEQSVQGRTPAPGGRARR